MGEYFWTDLVPQMSESTVILVGVSTVIAVFCAVLLDLLTDRAAFNALSESISGLLE